MKRGKSMRRSAAEAEQYQLYTEFLKVCRNVTAGKSLAAYAGSVTARGRLTRAVREAELLPQGAESLLTVTDPAQIRAIRNWWELEGRISLAAYRTHMTHWLAFRNTSSAPLPPTPAPTLPLREPPHGVRLRFLLRAFLPEAAPGAKSLESASDIYELLQSITGYQYTPESLREHTAAFRQLRRDLLGRIDNDLAGTAAILVRQYARSLKNGCEHVVTQVMKQYGAQILTDLARRRIPYEDSLLPSLEALRAAGSPTDCAAAFLSLLRTVLADCDPAHLVGDAALAPGAALRDPRLWDSGLLWFWMDQAPLPSAALEAFLPLPRPVNQGRRSHLAVVLLNSMLALADKPDSRSDPAVWKAAGRWMEEAVVFCGQFWDDLRPALAQPPAGWCGAVPELRLLEGPQNALFRVDLLLRQADLLLRMPVADLPKSRQTVHLVRVQSAVEAGLSILRNRMEDNLCEAMEIASGNRYLRQALARLRLQDAEVHRRFGLLEAEENCLTDVVGMYIRPSREALSDAQAFGFLTDEELAVIAPEQRWICQACFDTYFGKDSDFRKRLRLLPDTTDRPYQEEYTAWRTCFAALLPKAPVSAPQVHLPLDSETLRNPTFFKPIYSGVFDSVLGRDFSVQQKPVELSSFQLLGSSQTSLLQMNQVVDNLTTLRMLHIPGYRAACREGFITLSCFGKINSPRDYLIQNLRDPKFRFSCADAFFLPEDAAAEDVERSCRGVMLRYLDGNARLTEFLSDCRALMEFLAESYKVVFDSFQLSDLRRFHQNPDTRYPKRQWTASPPRTLHDVLTERIRLLLLEAQLPGSRKDLRKLERIKAQAEREELRELPNRSAYDNAIDMLLSTEKDPEVRFALEDLRSVVHQSYFISNGSLCCDNVLLTERDPNLILTQSQIPGISYREASDSDTLEYAFRQAWKPGTRENIGWPDICEIALISRELDLKSKHMTAGQRIAQKERETGLTYQVCHDDLLLEDYTAKLSTGERTHVCPAADEDQHTHLLEMRKAK